MSETMDDDDKQVFLAAAILLSAAVGQRHEPVDEKQIQIAVTNARKLKKAVEKLHEEATNQPPLADLSGGGKH